MQKNQPKLVVIGGGTGIHPVLQAAHSLPLAVTSIVTTADSGGSTGRLRTLFGFPAVGDLRQSITALADKTKQPHLAELLDYRFEKGEGLRGHTIGNLILTALQDITKNTTAAVASLTSLFHITGTILPVSETNTQLVIHYADGSNQVGEHLLDTPIKNPKKIDHISLTDNPHITPEVKQAILEADVISIGPGDYYDSLLATLVVGGMKDAIEQSNAKIIYFTNLMSKHNTTHGMTVSDFVNGIEQVIGKSITYIVHNTETIPSAVLEKYKAEESYSVNNDLIDDARLIKTPLLDTQLHIQQPQDFLHRSLLRHSKEKIARVLGKLI